MWIIHLPDVIDSRNISFCPSYQNFITLILVIFSISNIFRHMELKIKLRTNSTSFVIMPSNCLCYLSKLLIFRSLFTLIFSTTIKIQGSDEVDHNKIKITLHGLFVMLLVECLKCAN